MSKKTFEEEIKKKLEDFSPTPPAEVWQSMQSQLQPAVQAARWPWIAGAAVVTGAMVYFLSTGTEQPVPTSFTSVQPAVTGHAAETVSTEPAIPSQPSQEEKPALRTEKKSIPQPTPEAEPEASQEWVPAQYTTSYRTGVRTRTTAIDDQPLYRPTDYSVQHAEQANRDQQEMSMDDAPFIRSISVFTPNSDGMNDSFNPFTDSRNIVVDGNWKIYAKGMEIMELPAGAQWDGLDANGEQVENGLYTYYAPYHPAKQPEKTLFYTGSVLVRR